MTINIKSQSELFWKRFVPLFTAGSLGVLASASLITRMVERAIERTAIAPPLPLPALVAVSLVQSTVLVAAAVAAGVATAPRLGLRSHLAEQTTHHISMVPALRPELPLAAGLGVGTAVVMIVLDAAVKTWTGIKLLSDSRTQLAPATTISGVLARLLYGGITEELLLRWGLMSSFAWLIWKFVQRQQPPSPLTFWTANVGTALLFGIGHLPAASTMLPLSAPLVAQIISLNALAGIVFGWLYWRRSLEAAVVAHAMAHVVFIAATALGVLGLEVHEARPAGDH